MQEFEYFVMDGRAKFDFDRAVVLEALGRQLPSNKKGYSGNPVARTSRTPLNGK
ncbi:hypothetical protein [Citrobacter sp. Cb223]|uniref:hypothetical protein n=1 Tax=Citrobacter sp. Cb223 TaxID=2985035 RepID=UPI0025759714|nr:hypothetical protein [Citrobacter sp. Cb223]MDM3310692.1 hypothetical protein [Citrobacter sp. Cb223]